MSIFHGNIKAVFFKLGTKMHITKETKWHLDGVVRKPVNVKQGLNVN